VNRNLKLSGKKGLFMKAKDNIKLNISQKEAYDQCKKILEN